MERREKLKREIRREALTRLEDAARSTVDFQNVVREWNKLDKNRRRRVRSKEIGQHMDILEWDSAGESIVPRPLNHVWCWQMMRGDFLDVIYDCPYDLHEMTSSRNISELVNALRENQKEVLYLRAIKLYSPQLIAAIRNQSDRNIRKVYDTLIESLRRDLADRLENRWRNKLPLTLAQKEFMDWYRGGKKKAALDGGEDK